MWDRSRGASGGDKKGDTADQQRRSSGDNSGGAVGWRRQLPAGSTFMGRRRQAVHTVVHMLACQVLPGGDGHCNVVVVAVACQVRESVAEGELGVRLDR